MNDPRRMRSRTVLISPRFPPECCGVGDFTAHLARTMQAAGRDVLVLTEPGAGPRPEGIAVLEQPLRGWRNLRRVLRAIRGSGATHVQLEYSSYGWGRWGFRFAVNALVFALRLRGYTVTLGLHELYLRLSARPFELLCGLVQRVHFAGLFLAANEVATNTPGRVRAVQRWLPWRAHTVRFRPTPSNIPVARLSPAERDALRGQLGASPATMVVATFGSFHPAKNYEAVIEAVIQLQLEAKLPTQLWLLGDQRASPSCVARLRLQAKSLGRAAFWPGHAPAAQVSAWLQAADIFVLSQSDGHLTRSGAFMAAAEHGLPVVAVRNDAEQADFRDGEEVCLVDRGSAESFAAAIARLAGNAPLRARLGQNLRRLYLTRFDWEHLVFSGRTAAPAAAALGSPVAPPVVKSKG